MLLVGAALVACSGSPSSPHSLRVVYRVVDSSRLPVRTTEVVVDDQPPYSGRVVTTGLGGSASDEGHHYLVQPDGSVRTVTAVAPGFAASAHGLQVALAAAERHHLVRRSADDSVDGRPCTTWETLGPLDSDAFALPTATDEVSSCVTADGLLLKDSWTLRGRVVRTRTATSVGPAPALRLAPEASPVSSAGMQEQVKVVSRATLLRALAVAAPAAPAGLRPDRQAAVITLDPDGQVGSEGGVLTWTDGRRLVVLRLERGLTHRLVAPSDGVQVGAVRLQPTSYGLEATFASGSFVVTVQADLPEDQLLSWVLTLRL